MEGKFNFSSGKFDFFEKLYSEIVSIAFDERNVEQNGNFKLNVNSEEIKRRITSTYQVPGGKAKYDLPNSFARDLPQAATKIATELLNKLIQETDTWKEEGIGDKTEKILQACLSECNPLPDDNLSKNLHQFIGKEHSTPSNANPYILAEFRNINSQNGGYRFLKKFIQTFYNKEISDIERNKDTAIAEEQKMMEQETPGENGKGKISISNGEIAKQFINDKFLAPISNLYKIDVSGAALAEALNAKSTTLCNVITKCCEENGNRNAVIDSIRESTALMCDKLAKLATKSLTLTLGDKSSSDQSLGIYSFSLEGVPTLTSKNTFDTATDVFDNQDLQQACENVINGDTYKDNPLGLYFYWDDFLAKIIKDISIDVQPYNEKAMKNLFIASCEKMKNDLDVGQQTMPIKIVNSENNGMKKVTISLENTGQIPYDIAYIAANIKADANAEENNAKKLIDLTNTIYKLENDYYFFEEFEISDANLKEYKDALSQSAKQNYITDVLTDAEIADCLKKLEDLKSKTEGIQKQIINYNGGEYPVDNGCEIVLNRIKECLANLLIAKKINPDALNPGLAIPAANFIRQNVEDVAREGEFNINLLKSKVAAGLQQYKYMVGADPGVMVLPISELSRDEKSISGTMLVGGCKLYPIISREINNFVNNDNSESLQLNMFFNNNRAAIFNNTGYYKAFLEKHNLKITTDNKNLDVHGNGADPVLFNIPIGSNQYSVFNYTQQGHSHGVVFPAEEFLQWILDTNDHVNIKLGSDIAGGLRKKIEELKKNKEQGKKEREQSEPLNKQINEINQEISNIIGGKLPKFMGRESIEIKQKDEKTKSLDELFIGKVDKKHGEDARSEKVSSEQENEKLPDPAALMQIDTSPTRGEKENIIGLINQNAKSLYLDENRERTLTWNKNYDLVCKYDDAYLRSKTSAEDKKFGDFDFTNENKIEFYKKALGKIDDEKKVTVTTSTLTLTRKQKKMKKIKIIIL